MPGGNVPPLVLPSFRGKSMIDGKRAESRKPSSVLATFRLLVGALFSFEAIFALYLYSNALKFIHPFPFPVDETLVFAAMAVPVGMFIVLRRGIYQPALQLLAPILIFFGWALVTWTWSPSRIIAKQYVMDYITLDLFSMIAAGFVIAPSRDRIVRFLLCSAFFAMIISVYGIWLSINYGPIMFYKGFDFSGRAYLLWSYGAAFGAMVLFAITIFSRFLSGKQLVGGAFFGICAYFVLISGSRGALLGFGLGCLLLLLGSGRLWEGRRLRVTTSQIIAFFVLLLAVGYIGWMVVEGIASQSIGRFVKLFRQAEDDSVILTANRFDYYAFAVKAWLDAPIFGNGLGSFSILYRNMERYGAQPHNAFLEILAEYGLVGMVLFLLVLGSLFNRIRKAGVLRDPVMLTLLAMFAVQFANAMVARQLSGQMGLFAMFGLLTAAPALARRTTSSRFPSGGNALIAARTARSPFWIRWQA